MMKVVWCVRDDLNSCVECFWVAQMTKVWEMLHEDRNCATVFVRGRKAFCGSLAGLAGAVYNSLVGPALLTYVEASAGGSFNRWT